MAPKAPLREDIIAAAARVFQSKGYHGATVEDVANELNMLKGSLYYYIQKKEDLLLAIVSKPIEELLNGCKEIAGRNLPIKKKVKECILFHTRVVSKHWSAISVYLQEMFGTTPTDSDSELARVQRLYREYQSIIIELINEGIEKKSVSERPRHSHRGFWVNGHAQLDSQVVSSARTPQNGPNRRNLHLPVPGGNGGQAPSLAAPPRVRLRVKFFPRRWYLWRCA